MNFFIAVLLLASSAPLTAGIQAPDLESARQFVHAFEMRLRAWPKGKEAERDEAIRDFFANLKDPVTKLAAIDMTWSRYVFVIPRKLTSELMGKLLKDADRKVRVRAALSLGRNGLGGEHFESVIALLREPREEGLEEGLKEIVYAMGRSADARFYPYLRELLKHKDGLIRSQVISTLRHWPHERDKVRGDAMALWNDPHQQVRYALLDFADVETKDGLALLGERLKDPSSHVRTHAVDFLGRSKQPGVTEMIVATISDENPHVRGKALEALANRKAKEHIGLVLAKLQDEKEDLYVRRMALAAMRAMLGEINEEIEPALRVRPPN